MGGGLCEGAAAVKVFGMRGEGDFLQARSFRLPCLPDGLDEAAGFLLWNLGLDCACFSQSHSYSSHRLKYNFFTASTTVGMITSGGAAQSTFSISSLSTAGDELIPSSSICLAWPTSRSTIISVSASRLVSLVLNDGRDSVGASNSTYRTEGFQYHVETRVSRDFPSP